MAFLELTGVQKRFGDVAAVLDFNLAAERGEFVSFLGPSGCGKTTTLRMIAGFEQPTGGTITVNGTDITHRSPNQRNVGMVFQSYALFPNMTVAGNIGFGLKVRKRPKAEIDRRVGELLELIHLEGRGDRYPYQLSGGQQQRVALARALAIEPQVLLLDEPLSALDAKIRIVLRKEIRAIQRQLGITTVYVTHDQEEALSLSDRVVVMSEGRIEQIGTPFEIYNFPATTFVASFVGTLNLVEACVIDAGGRPAVDRRPGDPDGQGGHQRRAGWPRHARAPAGGDLVRRGAGRLEPAARHDRGHQLPRLDRPHPAAPGQRSGSRRRNHHLARHVQRAAPGAAGSRRNGHDPLPAGGLLRARRGPRRGGGQGRPRSGGVNRSLAGIDLVVFDKDGTLIEFDAMWAGWSADLATNLERASGIPIREALFGMLGFDPVSGRVLAGGGLAATPMARLRDLTRVLLVAAGLGESAADAALDEAWHAPDPVALAHPLADLPGLFARLRGSGKHIAVATSDDRDPTERTLAALGLTELIDAVVCADDGIAVKPAPDMVVQLCSQLGIEPARTAVVGDSAADLEMGRRAGAGLVVGVLTGVGEVTHLEPVADLVVASVADLVGD